MGPLLRAVNQVADALAAEFPHVLVDTLAYQYSRPATKLTKPRKNVVIRLANIECNFAQPLTHPSNEPFQKDMADWAAISNRTYIWNCEYDRRDASGVRCAKLRACSRRCRKLC